MERTTSYLEMKRRHQQEVNELPMFFAFSNKQFDEGMEKLGLKPTDTNKIYRASFGGFYKKTDDEHIASTLERHRKEREQAIKDDTTGSNYIFDMFNYELANHEFCYTGSTEDTLDALGLTEEEVNANPALHNGLKKAIESQWEQDRA